GRGPPAAHPGRPGRAGREPRRAERRAAGPRRRRRLPGTGDDGRGCAVRAARAPHRRVHRRDGPAVGRRAAAHGRPVRAVRRRRRPPAAGARGGPIVVGGAGEAAFRRALTRAHGWSGVGAPDEVGANPTRRAGGRRRRATRPAGPAGDHGDAAGERRPGHRRPVRRTGRGPAAGLPAAAGGPRRHRPVPRAARRVDALTPRPVWAGVRGCGHDGGMCGRYASIKAPADLADEFRAVDATDGAARADYNVAPTKQIITVVERHPRDEEGTPDPDRTERTLRMVRWGLVPSWAKDPKGGARMINARSESVATKPAFRRAFNSRRCLIPADGWFEWQRGPEHKQPYYTHYADGSSLAMAGLWEYWKPKDDPNNEYPGGLVTATVLT